MTFKEKCDILVYVKKMIGEDEKKTFREFVFTEEGLCEAIAWLNSWYEGGFRHLIS